MFLALSLFMFRGFANYANSAFAPDYLAIFTNFFYAAYYFHDIS